VRALRSERFDEAFWLRGHLELMRKLARPSADVGGLHTLKLILRAAGVPVPPAHRLSNVSRTPARTNPNE
jgi:hypothetical protein